MSIQSGAPNKWRTKYQMEGLKDGEWYNLRDKNIYIKENGKLVIKRRKNETE